MTSNVVDRQKLLQNVTRAVDAELLENGRKKPPFSKISGYVWTWPKLSKSIKVLPDNAGTTWF